MQYQVMANNKGKKSDQAAINHLANFAPTYNGPKKGKKL